MIVKTDVLQDFVLDALKLEIESVHVSAVYDLRARAQRLNDLHCDWELFREKEIEDVTVCTIGVVRGYEIEMRADDGAILRRTGGSTREEGHDD